ncbi:unnamed protein product [Oncorhynchus mykiss]|uniref:Uncharacterized protein n=1 Tax=Oncorhynchus mykiss TaxID=8022 RepID=A0A060XFX8_ONCMY|nr:unnamed protein product [Oncorhynchus mykiss]
MMLSLLALSFKVEHRALTSRPHGNSMTNGKGWFTPPSPRVANCRGLWENGALEWLDLRCRGVRNANAYILVYDICCVESFEYVKMIRQQIMEHREGSSSEVPILVVGSKRDLQRQRFTPRRAVSVLVKKTWKCGYVECSAKFNWHVVLLFKELLGIAVGRGMKQNHTPGIRLQGALQRNRCTVM